jgi:LAGLIDADG endonuclease
MATVITNLLSAIPIFGPDLVELIWGGLFNFLKTDEPNNSNIIIKILLFAGNSPNLGYGYSNIIIPVKKPLKRKPAEIRNKSYFEVSQRLNANDLKYAWLVGLIEGDGWFSITKNANYLKYEFGIELNVRDVQLIYKIKTLLGVGVVNFRNKEDRSETVIFRIRNKLHLIEVILPIFDKYSLISNKQHDYLRFKKALLSNIKFSSMLENYIRPSVPINAVEDILNKDYFSS